MSWTTPRTWANGDIPTGAMLNEQLRDNFNFLFGKLPKGAMLSYRLAQNTASANYTSGAWRTAVINTKEFDPDNIVTLATNVFTLGVGNYLIMCESNINLTAAAGVGSLHARLRNITSNATIAQMNVITANHSIGLSFTGYASISASSGFELQFYPSIQAGQIASNISGEDEIYTWITIVKVG